MLIDVHAHEPRDGTSLDDYVAALERFDSRVIIAALGARGAGWGFTPTAEHCRDANNLAAEIIRVRPDRFVGYCYVNPEHGRATLDEMERCLLRQADIFAALKLWVAVRCSDRRLDPLMELCAAHGVPVLQHTWMKVGPEGPGAGNLPGESTPEDLLALARRHPRVKFFGGHTGGDWEWGVAALKQVDNVWLDIAGGDASGQYTEIALSGVGAGRIVFGTDMRGRSIPSQLAKVLSVPLPDTDLERILWRNAAEVLGERLPAAWRAAIETGGPRPLPLPDTGRGGTTAAVGGVLTAADLTPPAVVRGASPLPVGEGKGAGSTWSASRIPSVPRPDEGYFDANSYLGEWPPRRLNGDRALSPRELVEHRQELMDRRGIRRAAVSRLEGVFLKDASVANRELFDLVRENERFLPVYTLNPTFPDWREQLERCIQEWGLAPGKAGLRLLPSYHGYPLDAPAVDRFLEAAAPLRVPLLLPVQLEDARMHHPAMQVPDLLSADVAALVNRWPEVHWIVCGATAAQIASTARLLGAAAQCRFDISRVQGPVDSVRMLHERVGVERLVFGTNLPLHVCESPIMELADAHLPADEDAAVRFGNAHQAFGLR